MSGLAVVERLKAELPEQPVIMISGQSDPHAAAQAIKAGAAEYLPKPFDLDQLVHLIRMSMEHAELAREVAYLRARSIAHGTLIGDSAASNGLRQQIDRIARSSARTVLLLGASGTGKAVVAQALHSLSERGKGPFVELNCASLPEQLVEAELFGAEKGAYTGAHQRRAGLVALADGGTLFLDEIGELALALQAKLLTFLENRSYRPIGGGRERRADVRVIAATNRSLPVEVQLGRFREDLYYRLNVVPIELPPLKSRGGDVLLLAEHFARQFAADEGVAPVRFSAGAQALLLAHAWPGNVRELRNLVERLTILHPAEFIESQHLPSEFHADANKAPPSIADHLALTEREMVLQAITRTGGKKAAAAELLGISRHALGRRMKRHSIE
jgi:DNA-binding NtrC family response regulator